MENKKGKDKLKTRILMALLSVVIAFGLWLYVVTVVSPESEKTFYNIPISLEYESDLEEDRGLMVTSTDIPTVNLRLEGSRTDLDKLNNSNITVEASVLKISDAGVHELSYDVSFPGDVPDNAITILKRTPDTVTVTVEERISKTVKVKVSVDKEQIPEGIKVDTENAVLNVEEFQIAGPKRILDRVEQAVINVDVTGKTSTISNQNLLYTLLDADGDVVDKSMVDDNLETTGIITLEKLSIGMVKEIKLVPEIIDGGGATAETCDIKTEPESITVFGSKKLLDSMGDKLVVGTIDLSKLAGDTEQKFALLLPEGISSESGEIEATVSVKFPNLSTKTLRVTNIKLINKPVGYSAQAITKVLDVTVRGPKKLIDSISESDVTVKADVKDAQEGTEALPVEITFTSKYVQVGAVGTYTVSATVRKQ